MSRPSLLHPHWHCSHNRIETDMDQPTDHQPTQQDNHQESQNLKDVSMDGREGKSAEVEIAGEFGHLEGMSSLLGINLILYTALYVEHEQHIRWPLFQTITTNQTHAESFYCQDKDDQDFGFGSSIKILPPIPLELEKFKSSFYQVQCSDKDIFWFSNSGKCDPNWPTGQERKPGTTICELFRGLFPADTREFLQEVSSRREGGGAKPLPRQDRSLQESLWDQTEEQYREGLLLSGNWIEEVGLMI